MDPGVFLLERGGLDANLEQLIGHFLTANEAACLGMTSKGAEAMIEETNKDGQWRFWGVFAPVLPDIVYIVDHSSNGSLSMYNYFKESILGLGRTPKIEGIGSLLFRAGCSGDLSLFRTIMNDTNGSLLARDSVEGAALGGNTDIVDLIFTHKEYAEVTYPAFQAAVIMCDITMVKHLVRLWGEQEEQYGQPVHFCEDMILWASSGDQNSEKIIAFYDFLRGEMNMKGWHPDTSKGWAINCSEKDCIQLLTYGRACNTPVPVTCEFFREVARNGYLELLKHAINIEPALFTSVIWGDGSTMLANAINARSWGLAKFLIDGEKVDNAPWRHIARPIYFTRDVISACCHTVWDKSVEILKMLSDETMSVRRVYGANARASWFPGSCDINMAARNGNVAVFKFLLNLFNQYGIPLGRTVKLHNLLKGCLYEDPEFGMLKHLMLPANKQHWDDITSTHSASEYLVAFACSSCIPAMEILVKKEVAWDTELYRANCQDILNGQGRMFVLGQKKWDKGGVSYGPLHNFLRDHGFEK